MSVLFNTSGVMAGRFQAFGASAAGSVTKTTLLSGHIASVMQGNGNYVSVEKFKATVAKSGSNSVFQLELSSDGSSYTEVARLELPDYGIISDPDCGIFIPSGYYYRVSVTQSTAARCSASLIGRTAISDTVDI